MGPHKWDQMGFIPVAVMHDKCIWHHHTRTGYRIHCSDSSRILFVTLGKSETYKETIKARFVSTNTRTSTSTSTSIALNAVRDYG